jgi:hypothetical protein
MARGEFNDTCCFDAKCQCSCYGGEASMALSDPDVLANRQAYLEEIVSLYPGLDMEIDLERWSFLFNDAKASQAQRYSIMTLLLRAVRHGMSPGTRLGLRVPPDFDVLAQLGVNLTALATDAEVMLDYATLGVSFFAVMASASDFEEIRAQVPPECKLLFEISELHEYYQAGSVRTQQLLTKEQLTTVALDAYAMGADGVSTFNFQYYRTAGLEPPYEVLPRLTDENWLGSSSQYYFWGTRNSMTQSTKNNPLPFALSAQNRTLRVRTTAVKAGAAYAPFGLLRLRFNAKVTGAVTEGLRVYFGGVLLAESANTTRLFPSKVRDIDEGKYTAYAFPSNLLNGGGASTVQASCTSALRSGCAGRTVALVDLQLPVEQL